MYVVAYNVLFAMKYESTTMKYESTMVNSKKKKISDLVLLFYIAMHDPTIYLSFFLPPRVTSNVYQY